MKYLLLILLVSFLSGCTSRTEFGKCIGINGNEEPRLTYNFSVKNMVLAFVFSETVIVPGVVIFYQLKCPVGIKTGNL